MYPSLVPSFFLLSSSLSLSVVYWNLGRADYKARGTCSEQRYKFVMHDALPLPLLLLAPSSAGFLKSLFFLSELPSTSFFYLNPSHPLQILWSRRNCSFRLWSVLRTKIACMSIKKSNPDALHHVVNNKQHTQKVDRDLHDKALMESFLFLVCSLLDTKQSSLSLSNYNVRYSLIY